MSCVNDVCAGLVTLKGGEDNSWLKKVQNLAVDGHSGRGRPCKTWEHVIMKDLHVKGLRREVAQNREWRSATT